MPPKPPRIPKKPTAPPYNLKYQPHLYARTRNAAPTPSPRPSQSSYSSPPPRPRSTARTVVRASGTAIFVVGIFIFVRDNFMSLDTVRGSSMAPTLSPHAHERGELDRVFIKRGFTVKNVERGDIITFWKPHKQDEISIKRVIGLPGDTVYPHRGYALDDDLRRQPRLGLMDGLSVGEEQVEDGAVVVPAGHVWVEGDNWRRSYDSCDFGPVSRALIDGKATKVWGGIFKGWRQIEDRREKRHRSRVVEASDSVMEKVSVD